MDGRGAGACRTRSKTVLESLTFVKVAHRVQRGKRPSIASLVSCFSEEWTRQKVGVRETVPVRISSLRNWRGLGTELLFNPLATTPRCEPSMLHRYSVF